eukprot:TRINITY_DN59007_c0_g1_i1.p2 TRINITY_DN59007_c0_g1~~TRINITY_DN59007_c0_g1_i1.p2  ORF type:complete len:129 (-),score=14.10 TRINITY_DN59007_c0_g1_i1:1-387(-)
MGIGSVFRKRKPSPVKMDPADKERIRAETRALYQGASTCGDAIEEGGLRFEVMHENGCEIVEQFFTEYDVKYTRSGCSFYIGNSEADMLTGGGIGIGFPQWLSACTNVKISSTISLSSETVLESCEKF